MNKDRMSVWSFINVLIERYQFKTFLEIGYGHGWGYERVKCATKTSVDPNPASPGFVIKKTSDQFFNDIPLEIEWDLIFVDGDHSEQQVYRDIQNALKHLSPSGIIVCHDSCPECEELTAPNSCGTGWRAVARQRIERNDLMVAIVDYDGNCQYGEDRSGWGVITRGYQIPYTMPFGQELNYQYMEMNRIELMNVMSVGRLIATLDASRSVANPTMRYVTDWNEQRTVMVPPLGSINQFPARNEA